VLESMQKSYKRIKESDIDGLVIDIVEYKYMNFDNMDEEIDMVTQSYNRKIYEENKLKTVNKPAEIKSPTNLISVMNKTEENKIKFIPNMDDDIDGEPI